jgi:hypothetical protein
MLSEPDSTEFGLQKYTAPMFWGLIRLPAGVYLQFASSILKKGPARGPFDINPGPLQPFGG